MLSHKTDTMSEKIQREMYILRCWREGSDDVIGDVEWRFSLERIAGTDGRRHGFTSLRRLFEFLSRRLSYDEDLS